MSIETGSEMLCLYSWRPTNMSLFHLVWEIFPQTICSYHLTGCYIAERSLMGTQFMVNVKKKKLELWLSTPIIGPIVWVFV